jgi:hypothetical protein
MHLYMFKNTIFQLFCEQCFNLPKIKILVQNYLNPLLFGYAHLVKDHIKHNTGVYKIKALVVIYTVV